MKKFPGFLWLLCSIFLCISISWAQVSPDKTPMPVKKNSLQAAPIRENISKHSNRISMQSLDRQPLLFVRNDGQLDKKIKYYEKGAGHATYCSEDGIYLDLFRRQPSAPQGLSHDILKLSPINAANHPGISARDIQQTRYNYYLGNDPAGWHEDIPTYKIVEYSEIYKNIDLKVYGNNRRLEYDVIVRPGGDPNLVKFQYEGARSLAVNERGELEIRLDHGTLIQKSPAIYQEISGRKVKVSGQFKLLTDNTYTFTIAAYDTRKTLIIDPVIEYLHYMGGDWQDINNAVAIDNDGNAYYTGTTLSTKFGSSTPRDISTYHYDVFVKKVGPQGYTIYTSVFGGTAIDEVSGATPEAGLDIAVDNLGNAHITGVTHSNDFPTWGGGLSYLPFQNIHGGYTGDGDMTAYTTDAFYVAVRGDGQRVYSSYIGGGNWERGNAIDVDNSGNVFIAGHTAPYHYSRPSDFPVTGTDIIQPTYGGDSNSHDSVYPADAFITKIHFDAQTPSNTTLVFSTYFGGSGADSANGIVVDDSGDIYITGSTSSTNLPGTSSSPLQSSFGGGYDAFVTKINSSGTAILYSTYLGAGSPDYGTGIDVDSLGCAYVTGYVYGISFPLVNPIQDHANGGYESFVTKINAAGSSIEYSTFLGGTGWDFANAIAVDNHGSAYIAGRTNSVDFPIVNPIEGQDPCDGSYNDAFITRITPSGNALLYSTYYGGYIGGGSQANDYATGIAVDDNANAYISGVTYSECLPVASWQSPTCDVNSSIYVGYGDGFILKISDPSIIPLELISVSPEDGATAVEESPVVSATFYDVLNTTSIAGNFLLSANGVPVVGTSGSTGNHTATFTPSAPLERNTLYTATITTGMQSVDGGTLADDYTWSFTTIPPDPDLIPPTVISSSPPPYDQGWNMEPVANTIFTITFSEDMDSSTITTDSFFLETYDQNGTATRISGVVSYDSGSLTATFTPDEDLPYQKFIYISATRAITDLAGNPLDVAVSYKWDIMTECDPMGAVFTASYPVSNATDVPVDITISMTFDRDMDPNTFTPDTFYVYYLDPDYVKINGNVSYDQPTRTAFFTPVTPFLNGIKYTGVAERVTDQDGREIKCGATGFSFTTIASGDPCSPDTNSPKITPPTDITVNCTGIGGTSVALGTPIVSDSCDPAPVLTNDAPVLFTIGTTTVTWTATDASGNSGTASQQVTVANPDNACSVEMESPFVYPPPDIDGIPGFGEWPAETTNQIELDNGFIRVTNDRTRLYILIDMTADDGDDTDNPRDTFQLTFDVNNDGLITPGVDVNYSLLPDLASIRYQVYNGPDSWSGFEPETFSSVARGFGCFFGDGTQTAQLSANPPVFTCSQHRVWEIAIDLQEIGAVIGDTVSMGLQITSPSPSFTENYPLNFTHDFTNLIKINTTYRDPVNDDYFDHGSVYLDTNPIEFTQAIQDRQNSMPLVQDKDTVARVYVKDNWILKNTLCLVSLYAQKDDLDLPGSPITGLHVATRNIDRQSLWRGPFPMLLPDSWTQGDVTFYTVVRGMTPDDTGDRSDPVTITFTPKETPLIWTIPLNGGTETLPDLEDDDTISLMESYTRTIFPVPDIKFVRKPWQTIGTITDKYNAIDALEDYFDHVLMNWALAYMDSGTEPFELPGQIFGITPYGGGISTPPWHENGRGIVAVGGYGSDSKYSTMAHEINHNLGPGDCFSRQDDGMYDDHWGRHVSSEDRLAGEDDPNGQCIQGGAEAYGCGATGPDADWQALFDSDDIDEVGFDTRRPWLNALYLDYSIVSADTPDLMSYCFRQVYDQLWEDFSKAPYTNLRWISPYRWERLFNHFDTTGGFSLLGRPASMDDIIDVYYISGQVNVNGTNGSLKPVISSLGIAQVPEIPGEHAIEFLDSDNKIIESHPFHISFFDMETGQQQDVMSFHFNIPSDQVQPISKVNLMCNTQVLDTIEVSANPPVVDILSPNGGETWSGSGTITWQGTDEDGDDLTYLLSYSPDNGNLWIPIARNLTAESYTINTSVIPGGENSLVRVIATDGFHTAMDDSDAPFTVDQNPPFVSINSPANGDIFQIETKITLKGAASDPEDETVPDNSLVWFLNDEAAATGNTAELMLPAGQYTITLRASDSSGAASETSVVIEIVPCLGDYDHDTDVDGLDLFYQLTGETRINLVDFASNFGKISCD